MKVTTKGDSLSAKPNDINGDVSLLQKTSKENVDDLSTSILQVMDDGVLDNAETIEERKREITKVHENELRLQSESSKKENSDSLDKVKKTGGSDYYEKQGSEREAASSAKDLEKENISRHVTSLFSAESPSLINDNEVTDYEDIKKAKDGKENDEETVENDIISDNETKHQSATEIINIREENQEQLDIGAKKGSNKESQGRIVA